MIKEESVSPEGLRVDGRRPNELRRISCKSNIFHQADGSAYMEMGNTKCLATVYGPRELSSSNAQSPLNVTFTTASFSSGIRKQNLKKDRKLRDLATTIQSVFQAIIIATTFPRSQIDISIQIIQIDGGILQCAINATTLALIDAGIPMSDFVCACSAGFANETPILDLNLIEESANIPTLTVALTPSNEKVVMLTLESRLHMDHLEATLKLACSGARQLYEVLQVAVRNKTRELAMH